MRDRPVLLTDGGEPVRRALFETDGGQSGGSGGHADPRGIFAPAGTGTTEKDADADEDDEESGQSLLKKSLGTDGEEGETAAVVKHSDEWETGPDALTERPAETDPTSKDLRKSVEEAQQGELDTRGIFETRGDVLRDIREELRARGGRPGVSKSAEAGESGPSDGPADGGGSDGDGATDAEEVGLAVLEGTEQVMEDVEDLLANPSEPSGEEWAEIEERVNELEEQMADAPEPSTEREEAIWAAVQERAAELLRLLNPNGDGDSSDE